MTNEGCAYATLGEELLLERQYHRGAIDDLRHGFYPALVPCPDLGRNVIEHRYAGLVRRLRDLEVEARIVDENHQPDISAVQPAPNIPQQRNVARNVAQYLDEAHHGQPIRSLEELYARAGHAVPANAGQDQLGT